MPTPQELHAGPHDDAAPEQICESLPMRETDPGTLLTKATAG